MIVAFPLLAVALGQLAQAAPALVLSDNVVGKRIIIETDLLNFPDDAGAIAVANVLQNKKECTIIGISSNINSTYAPPSIAAINTYYDHPTIPLALSRPTNDLTINPYYTFPTPDYVSSLANPADFPEAEGNGTHAELPVCMYRRLLASAPDSSVTIASIGFLNNLYDLLTSGPDAASPLSGKDLIQKKVAELAVQGGHYNNLTGTTGATYNFNLNPYLAQAVLSEWPTNVTFLGSEIVSSIPIGNVLQNATEEDPVRKAYELNKNGTNWDFGSSDLATIYYAVRGFDEHGATSKTTFEVGGTGNIVIDPATGTMTWHDDTSGRQRYLEMSSTGTKRLQTQLNKLLSAKP